ncbi:ankyrin [Stipitochalara longipes BDJ]|nr:ankyrin [Stipitochalara longipes BDJ]
MASTNRGGRPKNAWTSTRLRKLIRLHELSNTKVELIPEILMREDGFRPCLRDVQKQLAAILPKNNMSSSRRRRRNITTQAEFKNMCVQLKPRKRRDELTVQRKTDIATQPTENLLDSVMAEERLYNPLAHWDYFSDLENPFVTLDQVFLGNSDPIHTANTSSPAIIATAKGNESKKDMRKRKLQSIIARSELSFVVSLLSSRWSASSLHTRVLSCISSTTPFGEQLLDMHVAVPANSLDRGFIHLIITGDVCTFHSLIWRPCCGLKCDDATRNCVTCGFSAVLHHARTIGQRMKYSIPKYQDTLDFATAPIDLLSHVSSDPVFSYGEDLGILKEESATIGFLETSIQSINSDCLMDQERSKPDHGEISAVDRNSDLVGAQDRFRNTALHYAAAAQNFEAVLLLLEIGIPPELLNASGQTFLHLLNGHRDVGQYIEILRHLMRQSRPFPFQWRDNYGVSIAQTFLLNTGLAHEIPVEQLSEVHSILGGQGFEGSRGEIRGEDLELDFLARLDTLPIEKWASGDSDLAIELDKNGETCLISILKKWPEGGDVNILLSLIDQLTKECELKTNINIYSRTGETALLIAAEKGICAAVELLLSLGANPNATCYRSSFSFSQSILEWTTRKRDEFRKENNDKLYAAILGCEKSLVAAGAMKEADPMDELG